MEKDWYIFTTSGVPPKLHIAKCDMPHDEQGNCCINIEHWSSPKEMILWVRRQRMETV